MILFFNKKTGDITGTIDGRIHTKAQLNTWVGDPKTDDRIIVEYVPIKENKDKKGKTVSYEYAPNTNQRELFASFDKKTENPLNYKVNLKTKELIKKK